MITNAMVAINLRILFYKSISNDIIIT